MALCCVTFNCNSIRNNKEIVKNILKEADVVCLQELMINKGDLDVLDSLDSNFNNISFAKDKETEGISEGRPSAGVAIYWRSHLSRYISPLLIDEYIIGIILNNGSKKVLFLNIYLPCDLQTFEALDDYRNALARLGNVIRDQNINNILLAGDFNADPSKGRFWKELLIFQKSFSLIMADHCLPHDSFTYLSPGNNATSWLDHIFCTVEVSTNISNVYINYEHTIFDHFPMFFHFNFSVDSVHLADNRDNILLNNDLVNRLVHWSHIDDNQKSDISLSIDRWITRKGILCSEAIKCNIEECSNSYHIKQLDLIFEDMKAMLLESTKEFSNQSNKKIKTVPGWNDNVKELHADARHHFLLWKGKGKPQSGPYLENMKMSRAAFKTALKICKDNEEQIRREKLLENLESKNFKAFWKEVNVINKSNNSNVNVIDGECDPSNICQMFSEKYKKIFANQAKDLNTQQPKEGNLSGCIRFSKLNVHEGIKKLKPSVGIDGVHSNHLKFCPGSCVDLIVFQLL